MTLHRPLRFFAPTLAVVLAAAAGATACGAVVDVANSTTADASVPVDASPDGGQSPDAQPDAPLDVRPDAATDGGVSAASWEVRFLPWNASQAFRFSVFDQVVLATPLPSAGSPNAPSYLLDLAGRPALPRVSLYNGTPFMAPGDLVAASPRGNFIAFKTGNSTVSFTIYEFSAGKVTARAPIALPAVMGDYGIVALADDGRWGAASATHVVFGGAGGGAAGLPSLAPNGATWLLPANQAYVRGGANDSPGTLCVGGCLGGDAVALGSAYRVVDVDDNRLLVVRTNGTADVWSISPAQKLGTLTGDFPSGPLARDTFYDSAAATGFRLATTAAAPGLTKVPFSSNSARTVPAQGGLAGFVRDAANQAIFVSPDPRVRLGSLLTASNGEPMVLGPLVPGSAVAFSEGNPVASGSAGFVAWTADGAQVLPPVGFSAAGDDRTLYTYYQSLLPARGALAMRSGFGFSLGGREVSAEFGTASTGFAKRAEGQTGLFDRNASTPRWLPRTGLPSNSYEAVADRGFTVLREDLRDVCLFQYGVTETWVATGRCLADPRGEGTSDVAGDAFALATATEVQISLPGQPRLRAASPRLSKIAFDGKRVLGFDATSTVYVYEIQGDRLEKVFERLVPGVRSVALDANSDRGLLGLGDGAAMLVAK